MRLNWWGAADAAGNVNFTPASGRSAVSSEPRGPHILDINGSELLILLVVAVFVIGPDRMPEYAAKLAKLVRQVRDMADSAKDQLREQMGPEFDEVDWKQYDPRQYDPRRIVREALMDDGSEGGRPSSPGDVQAGGFKAPSSFKGHDPEEPTPYDEEAT